MLYGGAARGGKTWAALMAAAQFVDVPGYSALLLRENFPDLMQPGAFVPESKSWWLGKPGAAWNEQQKRWTFPGGSTITFGYLDRDDAVYQYQGAQYQCVAEGTCVIMGDGSQKPIENIRPGEMVMTLQGPRAVTRVWPAKFKPCVEAVVWIDGVAIGRQVHPEDHPILTLAGWESYSSLASASLPYGTCGPTRCRCEHRSSSRCRRRSRCGGRLLANLLSGLPPEGGALRREKSRRSYAATAASSGGGQSGSAGLQDEHRVAARPHELSAPVVLHSPDARRVAPCSGGYEPAGAPLDSGAVEGSRGCCLSCRRPSGGRSPFQPVNGRPPLPSQDDAGPHTREPLPRDEADISPTHTLPRQAWYVHPYTREVQLSSEGVRLGSCSMTPIGLRKVYDLTIEDTNHYVTSSKLVNQNCIILDELTHHTEWRYRYLFSRLSRPDAGPLSEVPLRMRATANPGGKGHQWVKERFIDPRTREPGAVFVPARVADNFGVDQREYVQSLSYLDSLTRQQLLEGNWDAVEGGRFKREWFDNRYTMRGDYIVLKRPGETDGYQVRWQECQRFGTHDPAASAKRTADFSVSAAWYLTPRSDLVWWDCDRYQLEIPDQLPRLQGFYARNGLGYIGIEAVAANRAVHQLACRTNMIVTALSPMGEDKLIRATQAMVLAESGRVWLPARGVRAGFPLDDVESELLRFTGDDKVDDHDDVVDNLSYAAKLVSDGPTRAERNAIPTVYGGGR